MGDVTRVKINLLSGEIEFEGTESFVNAQLANLKDLIAVISIEGKGQRDSTHKRALNEQQDNVIGAKDNEPSIGQIDALPESFGEWLNKFPKGMNGSDQILIAGYYLQKKSETNDFKTGDANKLLKEQGIKLANPADSLKKLSSSKRVFVNSKNGKLSMYRVSQSGEEHIISLLTSKE